MGALSGLASLGVNKLFGSNQKGGFLISDSKVNQLIGLTAKQKQDILNALQTGSGVHIKPTKRQMGAGWGTILVSYVKVHTATRWTIRHGLMLLWFAN